MRVNRRKAGQVIGAGVFHRRGSVLADVEPQHEWPAADSAGRGHMGHEGLQALVVEAKAVDQRLGLRQAEHAGLGVACLRQRCDRAQFDKAKAHGVPTGDAAGVFIQAGGQADPVRQLQARQRHRVVHPLLGVDMAQHVVLGALDQAQGQVMRCLRVHAEQKRAQHAVGHKRHR